MQPPVLDGETGEVERVLRLVFAGATSKNFVGMKFCLIFKAAFHHYIHVFREIVGNRTAACHRKRSFSALESKSRLAPIWSNLKTSAGNFAVHAQGDFRCASKRLVRHSSTVR